MSELNDTQKKTAKLIVLSVCTALYRRYGLDYKIEYREDYFLCTTSGVAKIETFSNILDAIFGHKDWQSGMSYIVDHSDLDASTINADGVRQIAAFTKSRRGKAGVTRNAVVVPRDLEYGFARMWAVYVGDEDNMPTGIFRTLEEAIAWVSV